MNNEIEATLQSGTDEESELSEVNASRWARLFSAILDGLVIMIVTIPAMYLTGGFDGVQTGTQPSWIYNSVIGLLSIFIFILINAKFLINDGQTIGKKALGIKIVDMNGDLPDLKKHLLKRYATYLLPGHIPLLGQIFGLINILFIFGKQKRCVHDYVAGTKVVECD